MSFDQKINAFFSRYVLQYKKKYSKHYYYIYADYVELLSLFSNENFVTIDDFLDRMEENLILDKRFLFTNEDDEDLENETSEEENQNDLDENRAELNDLKQRFAESIFRVLSERSSLFGDDYPFLVEHNRVILKDNTNLTNRNKVYLCLLLCSSLDIFKAFMPYLTTEFEVISYHALRNFMPPHAEVKSFGKNSDYTGLAKEKIEALARDMKIEINTVAFSQISNRNRQEKGLDLIAWIPFDDATPNMLCILCQCACEKEWNGKLAEAGRYNNYYNFHRQKPLSSLFIPYNIVGLNRKDFIRNDEISIDAIIFERKRILNYLENLDFFETLYSYRLVQKCIDYQEPVV
ncbi:MAG: hypothetical protein KIG88_04495 [Weeksellaceae bacterium]|nr:hypothetical protein [Weeksellaceae bacterium]